MEECKDLLECPICLSEFIDPYTLKCLHSFCKECLEENCKDKTDVNCPMCQSVFKVGTWQPDFRLKAFKNYLNSTKTNGNEMLKTCEMCETNIQVNEAHLCEECEEILCKSCGIIHGKHKRTKSHNVYSITSNPIPFCEIHNKKFEYFCENYECQTLLCVTCIVESHEGHRKCTIEKHVDRVSRNILKLVENADEKIKKIQSYKDYSNSFKQEVQEKFKVMKMTAKDKRDLIITKANEVYEKEITAISNKEEEINKQIADNDEVLDLISNNISCFKKYSVENLRSKNYHGLIKIEENLSKLLNEIMSYKFTFIDVEEICLKSEEFDNENIERVIASFIGSFLGDSKVTKEEIWTNETILYYTKVCKPQVFWAYRFQHVFSIDYFFFTNIIHDADNDALFYVRRENNIYILVKHQGDESLEEKQISGSEDFLFFILTILSHNQLLIFFLNERHDEDNKLLSASKTDLTSSEFNFNFCETSEICKLCSSSDFVFILSLENVVYKYCSETKTEERINLELPNDLEFVFDMIVSKNLNYIALSYKSKENTLFHIIVFSFKNENILWETHSSEDINLSYLTFLTENILAVSFLYSGQKRTAIGLYGANNGKLIRKFDLVETVKEMEENMKGFSFYFTKGKGESLIFWNPFGLLKIEFHP